MDTHKAFGAPRYRLSLPAIYIVGSILLKFSFDDPQAAARIWDAIQRLSDVAQQASDVAPANQESIL